MYIACRIEVEMEMRWARLVARIWEKNVYIEGVRREGKPVGKNRWDDLEVDGRVMLKWMLKENLWEDADGIRLAQDRDKWWAVVNAVMDFCVP